MSFWQNKPEVWWETLWQFLLTSSRHICIMHGNYGSVIEEDDCRLLIPQACANTKPCALSVAYEYYIILNTLHFEFYYYFVTDKCKGILWKLRLGFRLITVGSNDIFGKIQPFFYTNILHIRLRIFTCDLWMLWRIISLCEESRF